MSRSVSRVVRRGDTFYFRMAIPRQLVDRLGRREVKLSLRTCSLRDARLRGRLLSNAMDILFEGVSIMPSMTLQTINDRIREYFQACLNKSLEHAYLLPTDPAIDISWEVASLRQRVEDLREQLVRQSFSAPVRAEAQELLVASGQTVDMDALRHASNAVLRAEIEDARILAARLSGDYAGTAPIDPLFTGMQPTGLPPLPGEPTSSQPDPTLGSVAQQFFALGKARLGTQDSRRRETRH